MGRTLMSLLLSAQASGRKIDIDYTQPDTDGSGINHGTMFSVAVK